jgi:hypothetical protein
MVLSWWWTMLFCLKAQRLVQLALCNTLLQPSPGMADQLWDLRHKLLASLIESLTADFQRLGRLSSQAPDEHAHPIITSTLKLLGDLIKHMQSESSHTKRLLYSVIQVCVHTCVFCDTGLCSYFCILWYRSVFILFITWFQYVFHAIPLLYHSTANRYIDCHRGY